MSAFEKGRVDHLSRTGPDAAWEPDPFLMDERMLVVHVRHLGFADAFGDAVSQSAVGTTYTFDEAHYLSL